MDMCLSWLSAARHRLNCRARLASCRLHLARLEPYGVSEAILSEAMTIKKISLNRGTRNLMELDFEKTAPGQDIMHGLPQNRTEELMRDALLKNGGKVRYGYR